MGYKQQSVLQLKNFLLIGLYSCWRYIVHNYIIIRKRKKCRCHRVLPNVLLSTYLLMNECVSDVIY